MEWFKEENVLTFLCRRGHVAAALDLVEQMHIPAEYVHEAIERVAAGSYASLAGDLAFQYRGSLPGETLTKLADALAAGGYFGHLLRIADRHGQQIITLPRLLQILSRVEMAAHDRVSFTPREGVEALGLEGLLIEHGADTEALLRVQCLRERFLGRSKS
jgi:hypothetical protein